MCPMKMSHEKLKIKRNVMLLYFDAWLICSLGNQNLFLITSRSNCSFLVFHQLIICWKRTGVYREIIKISRKLIIFLGDYTGFNLHYHLIVWVPFGPTFTQPIFPLHWVKTKLQNHHYIPAFNQLPEQTHTFSPIQNEHLPIYTSAGLQKLPQEANQSKALHGSSTENVPLAEKNT